MNTFTDIGQFREVIRAVKSHHDYAGKDAAGETIYSHTSPYPTLSFRGTVKCHGTNAGIVKFADGHFEYQSRERVLSIKEDNAQFMMNMGIVNVDKLFEGIAFKEHCAIFGEWCGAKIQKGVALSNLPKMWIIFAVKIDNVYQDMENYKHLKLEENRIFNILQFPHFHINVDFEHPELAQNELVKITEAVELCCPVGKYFGIDGSDANKSTTGEGVVYEHLNDAQRYIFKVKGEKHQSSKIKKLVSVDTEEINNINEFVEYALTESRLSQGIDKLKEQNLPIELSSTSDYLRWVVGDVMKEEMDTIVKNQIDVKKLNGYISKKARQYWLTFVNKV
jgi:hypothetical protein